MADERHFEGGQQFPIDLVVCSLKELRPHTGLDESAYRRGPHANPAQGFVLYSLLDEAEKAAVVVMRFRTFLPQDGSTPENKAEATWRTSLGMVREEQQLRVRRLCESFVSSVLFGSTNEELYYRHYLQLSELGRYVSHRKELRAIYRKGSQWLDRSAETVVRLLARTEAEVDLTRAWYRALSARTPIETIDGLRGDLMPNFRSLLDGAIPRMTNAERITFGATYMEAYAGPSSSIHFDLDLDPNVTVDNPQIEVERLGLLSLHLILRVYALLGSPPDGATEQLSRSIKEASEPEKTFDAAYVRSEIEDGDFVTVRGFLVQVLSCATTALGYRTFEIEFLAERPFPEIERDWCMARDAVRFASQTEFVARVAQCLGEKVPVSLDDSALRMKIRELALDAWRSRLR